MLSLAVSTAHIQEFAALAVVAGAAIVAIRSIYRLMKGKRSALDPCSECELAKNCKKKQLKNCTRNS